jgi:hypothetical protein
MNAQEEFWNWFVQHQEELLTVEADREKIFDLLADALQRVDSHLTFEVGPKEVKREFVISAGGIADAFPAVVSLVTAAPTLTRWRVTAFRPRRMPLNIIEFGGKSADPQEVNFSLLDNGKIAGIRLFIPGFQEGNVDWRQIGYLLLDDALGEYDVETRLGLIKMYSPDAVTSEKRYPFPDLPQLFDRLESKLEGRNSEPS